MGDCSFGISVAKRRAGGFIFAVLCKDVSGLFPHLGVFPDKSAFAHSRAV